MSEPTRVYTNGEIKIEWRPEKCVHCESCWRGLPTVFDPNARPWVNMAGASTIEIVKQVQQCPDGALTVQFLFPPEHPCQGDLGSVPL